MVALATMAGPCTRDVVVRPWRPIFHFYWYHG
jgi:hypothetical protein